MGTELDRILFYFLLALFCLSKGKLYFLSLSTYQWFEGAVVLALAYGGVL